MNAITLYRIDPERNMSRFYRLDVQIDLFGSWCVVKEWGRIGRSGQIRTTKCNSLLEASRLADLYLKSKERRGYFII